MEKYDLIMLAILAAATLLGAWQGMAWQLASIASVVFSYMMACALREPVATLIPTGPPWDRPLAMLSLYVGTSLVVWVVFQVAARFIDRMKLKEFDRQVGAMMGLAKGVLLCAVVTFFSLSLLQDSGRQTVIDSYSGYCIAVLFDRADPFIPAEINDRLDPLLQQLGSHRQRNLAQPPESQSAVPVPTDFSQQPAPPSPWAGGDPRYGASPYADSRYADSRYADSRYNDARSGGTPQYGSGWSANDPRYGDPIPPASGSPPVPDQYWSAGDPRSAEAYRR